MTKSQRILIIDDEEILAKNLRTHFERCGWDARIEGTGMSAVIAAAEFRPGMILLDYRLPDMTGFETLEAIRAVHCCSCVLMTGHPPESLVAEARRHGIGRVLTKPFPMVGMQTQWWAMAAEFCSS